MLSHIDPKTKQAAMVDISHKQRSDRSASVETALMFSPQNAKFLCQHLQLDNNLAEIIATAKGAAMLAAKRTADLIPHCHPVGLSFVGVTASLDVDAMQIKIETTCKATETTGVEMEAFVAAQICALTIYDMIKAIDPLACISNCRLIAKSGGKSSVYVDQLQ